MTHAPTSALHALLVTCPRGVEGPLAEELAQLGAELEREQPGGMRVRADLGTLYRIALWSRLANRLLLPLAQFEADSADALYQAARGVNWSKLFDVDCSLAVQAQGTNAALRHSHFSALRVKDAVVDHFRETAGERPSVERRQPDVLIHLRLRRRRGELLLDLVGDSLHRRGYRLEGGSAPLRENLAAALLMRADWPGIASAGGSLVDPMCGSGTLLIEAAWMALGIAPGLARPWWGLVHWKQHDDALWRQLRSAAEDAAHRGRQRSLQGIHGFDSDPEVLEMARRNLERAGLSDHISLACRPLSRLRNPGAGSRGLVIVNPPYGERLGEVHALGELYASLGERLRSEFQGWQAAVFTANPQLGKSMGLRSHRQYRLYNAALPSQLLLFDVQLEAFVDAPPAPVQPEPPGTAPRARPLTEGATMLANRLRKNRRQLSRWLQREGVECYRLYDADMPEYASAIDLYGQRAHIAEYAPPASVEAEAAQQRLQETIDAVAAVTGFPPADIVVKQRRRQRGREQYQRQDQQDNEFTVREGSARLRVNLTDYIDTGLFLDHRGVRRWIQQHARDRRFLNLFCYTGTATVQAALGGARASTSVDLSRRYLAWAGRNLAENRIDRRHHELVQGDCREWLQQCSQRYDLILLDPPSFSNSSSMAGVLDIQRDHVELIQAALNLLQPGGQLIFSTNLRRFRLDAEALATTRITDWTRTTLDPDFHRARHPRHCWLLEPGQG